MTFFIEITAWVVGVVTLGLIVGVFIWVGTVDDDGDD